MKTLILLSLLCSALYSSAGCFLGIKAIVQEPNCYGENTAGIHLSLIGGTAPYNFAWSGGLPNAIAQTNLTAGMYSVTVTDVNGLSASYDIIVPQPYQIQINPVATAPQNYGDENGAIQTSCDGGAPNYTYLWTNGATTACLSGLGAGHYGVTVTDAVGCLAGANVMLTQPNAPVRHTGKQGKTDTDKKLLNTEDNSGANSGIKGAMLQLKDEDVQIYPNPSNSMLTVKTGEVNNLQITMIDLNGKIVSQLRSTPGETNLNVATMASGSYIIEIKAEDGTTVSKTVTVSR